MDTKYCNPVAAFETRYVKKPSILHPPTQKSVTLEFGLCFLSSCINSWRSDVNSTEFFSSLEGSLLLDPSPAQGFRCIPGLHRIPEETHTFRALKFKVLGLGTRKRSKKEHTAEHRRFVSDPQLHQQALLAIGGVHAVHGLRHQILSSPKCGGKTLRTSSCDPNMSN